jgi:hypothetical protein
MPRLILQFPLRAGGDRGLARSMACHETRFRKRTEFRARLSVRMDGGNARFLTSQWHLALRGEVTDQRGHWSLPVLW